MTPKQKIDLLRLMAKDIKTARKPHCLCYAYYLSTGSAFQVTPKHLEDLGLKKPKKMYNELTNLWFPHGHRVKRLKLIAEAIKHWKREIKGLSKCK